MYIRLQSVEPALEIGHPSGLAGERSLQPLTFALQPLHIGQQERWQHVVFHGLRRAIRSERDELGQHVVHLFGDQAVLDRRRVVGKGLAVAKLHGPQALQGGSDGGFEARDIELGPTARRHRAQLPGGVDDDRDRIVHTGGDATNAADKGPRVARRAYADRVVLGGISEVAHIEVAVAAREVEPCLATDRDVAAAADEIRQRIRSERDVVLSRSEEAKGTSANRRVVGAAGKRERLITDGRVVLARSIGVERPRPNRRVAIASAEPRAIPNRCRVRRESRASERQLANDRVAAAHAADTMSVIAVRGRIGRAGTAEP